MENNSKNAVVPQASPMVSTQAEGGETSLKRQFSLTRSKKEAS